jgi:ADP-ribose pyrophosphatase YjhB (NUDIX family)
LTKNREVSIVSRHTRYQGLIIQDNQILLIKHSQRATGLSYWVIPGGGLDGSETEEECVIREMKEETNLDVKIEQLAFDEPSPVGGVYKWRKSYICIPVSGEASPGYEPEPEAAAHYSISEVRWFDLRNASDWEEELKDDPFTYPQLIALRSFLGYG